MSGAELEVDVEGDEVEVEVEFKWSMTEHESGAATAEMTPSPVGARRGNGTRKPPRNRASKTQKH
jgi:hypothetical protein